LKRGGEPDREGRREDHHARPVVGVFRDAAGVRDGVDHEERDLTAPVEGAPGARAEAQLGCAVAKARPIARRRASRARVRGPGQSRASEDVRKASTKSGKATCAVWRVAACQPSGLRPPRIRVRRA